MIVVMCFLPTYFFFKLQVYPCYFANLHQIIVKLCKIFTLKVSFNVDSANLTIVGYIIYRNKEIQIVREEEKRENNVRQCINKNILPHPYLNFKVKFIMIANGCKTFFCYRFRPFFSFLQNR